MISIANENPRALAVWWKDLEPWVIPSSRFLRRPLPAGWKRVPIRNLVSQVTTRVKVEAGLKYKMAGVKWYGEGVFLRETVRGNEMSASQVTPLVPGALIYNRLFAWKASFAVVPPGFADCFVSNEFPQFVPDAERILSEYLYLFCTREATIQAVSAASTGSAAVSRNRFREQHFLAFEIPLPPLSEQETIVARWRTQRKEIAALRERAENRKRSIDANFLVDLGLESQESVPMPKGFAVWWEDLRRWGVRFNFLNQTTPDLSRGKFQAVGLGSLLNFVQYGTSKKSNTSKDGVAIIRMNNIVDGRLDLTELKYIQLPMPEKERLLLQDGDILFNRTNSKELVGKCAVFHATGEFVFASYLIRARVKDTKVDADFLALVINSPIGRKQIDVLSRQIIGQANINSEELRMLQIPLPPLAAQRQIMDGVATIRSEIDRAQDSANRRTQEIEKQIEALILGSEKVSQP